MKIIIKKIKRGIYNILDFVIPKLLMTIIPLGMLGCIIISLVLGILRITGVVNFHWFTVFSPGIIFTLIIIILILLASIAHVFKED